MSIATVADLFCGAGGLSLGFHAAGARSVVALDHDERAAETFESNFRRLQPDSPPLVLGGKQADMATIDVTSSPCGTVPDIVIGGPPCQGFSRLGRAKLNSLSDEGAAGDARNELYCRFLEAVRAWRPRALVMENVPGMLSVKGRNVALDVAADMAACGYRVGYTLLNAVWFGVPQFRERLFFIGVRDDLGVLPSAPAPTHRAHLPPGYVRPVPAHTLPLAFIPHFELSVDLRRARLPATTVADAFDDLPPLTQHLEQRVRPPRGDFRQPRPYRHAPHSELAHLLRNWPGLPPRDNIDDHAIRHTPRDFETFRRMLPGDRYPQAHAIAVARLRSVLEALNEQGAAPTPGTKAHDEIRRRIVPPYPEDVFVDKWRKLVPDEPSWTIPAHLAKDTYSHIHPDPSQARTISVREAARLQSFPDSFTFSGNMGDCYRQIGNAVPPLLAWAVAATVLSLLGADATPVPFASPLAGDLAVRDRLARA